MKFGPSWLQNCLKFAFEGRIAARWLRKAFWTPANQKDGYQNGGKRVPKGIPNGIQNWFRQKESKRDPNRGPKWDPKGSHSKIGAILGPIWNPISGPMWGPPGESFWFPVSSARRNASFQCRSPISSIYLTAQITVFVRSVAATILFLEHVC